MDVDLLKAVGGIAGIGGLALGVFLLLFKDFLAKLLLPQLGKAQAYKLLRLFLVLVWSIAVIGIAAYVTLEFKPKPVVLHNGSCTPTSVSREGVTVFGFDPDCPQGVAKAKLKAVQANIDAFLKSANVVRRVNALWILPAFEEYQTEPSPARWQLLREQANYLQGLIAQVRELLVSLDEESLKAIGSDANALTATLRSRKIMISALPTEPLPVSEVSMLAENYSNEAKRLQAILERITAILDPPKTG